MDCVGPFCVMDRYGSSRLGKSQDWKAKAGASSVAHWHEMIRDLSFGNSLIAGLKNDDDAVVVTAITYRRGEDGAPAYESVVIRDPYFGSIGWPEEILRSVNLEGERPGGVRNHLDPQFSDFTILSNDG